MIAPNWKPLKCPSVDKWINNCGTSIQLNTQQQKGMNLYKSPRHYAKCGKKYLKKLHSI